MAREQQARMNFAAGVVDRTAQVRVDKPRIALSAKEQVNWFSRVLGFMSMRPGLKFVGDVYGNPPPASQSVGAIGVEFEATASSLDPSLYLLLHGNGTDGNNLVDMSSYGHTPDAGAGLIISTSPDAWGGKAIEVNGSLGAADYREYNLPFASANQAFTLEYFLQIISSTGDGDGFVDGRQEVLRLSTASTYAHTANCAIHSSAHHLFTTPAAVSCLHANFGITGGTAERVHVVYQRAANAGTQCFLNGRYVGESGLTTDAITALRIGDPGTTSRNANAWIDALRFLQGVALYPQRVLESHGDVMFTPPTSIFHPDEV